jgi:hypothetical protein
MDTLCSLLRLAMRRIHSCTKSYRIRRRRDFAAITVLASAPNVLVVHPSVAAKSVGELIALAKAKPARSCTPTPVSAPAGICHGAFQAHGGRRHGACTVQRCRTHQTPQLWRVKYKCCQPRSGAAFPQIKSGRLRALAVTASKRTPRSSGNSYRGRVRAARLCRRRVVRSFGAIEDARRVWSNACKPISLQFTKYLTYPSV